jgi:type IV pilus assembly protein PilX
MTHYPSSSPSRYQAVALRQSGSRALCTGISFGRKRQSGIALAVALILLVVVTLVGLAAIHGTIMQQRMASNLYDRQLAFQSAEAAMRVAAARITTNPGDVARNCSSGGIVCPANPFADPNLSSSKYVSVTSGTASGQFAASALLGTQPQYVIENMGNWYDPSSDTGYNQSANSHQYGAQGTSTTAVYYRITARSADPTATGESDRAVVTLQAVIKG